MKPWILVDCEAVGVSPLHGKLTEFGAVHFESKATFHGIIRSRNGQTLINDPKRIAYQFKNWLEQEQKGRVIFVSDNPAWDWQWISWLFDNADIDNPFGHSGRRISDFWAGLQRDWHDTQSWKRFRRTKHDHNPVHDAMGNVEALETIFEIVKTQNATY